MPARWSISHFPACQFHVFLSHCDEDRQWLAYPLFDRLETLGVSPWIDRHDYPLGMDPFEALREGILRCRHIIYLVTLAMLNQGRGWPVVEKTYAGLLQGGLTEAGLELSHVELPLFFVPVGAASLTRSVWNSLRYRGRFAPTETNHVEWAAQQILRFVVDEKARAIELAAELDRDSQFRKRLERRNQPGIMDRVCARYPA
jgi:hypothetical protein